MTTETTTQDMLLESVKSAARTPVAVLTGNACHDCGANLTEDDTCGGAWEVCYREGDCLDNDECAGEGEGCICLTEEWDTTSITCPHHAELQGCGGGSFEPLDINYILEADGRLRGVDLLTTFGGPNIRIICIDGFYIRAEGVWYSDRAEWTGDERADDVVDFYREIMPEVDRSI